MWAKPGQRWANCAPPYQGWVWYSLDSNQGICSDTSSTEMQCLRPLEYNGIKHVYIFIIFIFI